MRLIDADHLTAIVNSATILSDRFKDVFCKLVDGEPTVSNAEQVVRCRQCKYRKDRLYCRRIADRPVIVCDTDFCSYGKA